jgi:acetyl-CoA acetyltransferase
MTRLMACPPTCGAAAAVLVSEAFADRHALAKNVWIAAQTMTTDTPSTFDAHDMMRVVGYDMARAGAQRTFAAAGIGPEDVDVVELHDCFAHNELLAYEALGCAPKAVANASSRTATIRMAARSSPIRRAGSCPRGTPWARPDLRNAASSPTSYAARRARAR